MNDDFLGRARMALDDMQGRVDGGKLAIFERTIDYAERLEDDNADMLEALEELERRITDQGFPYDGHMLVTCRAAIARAKGGDA